MIKGKMCNGTKQGEVGSGELSSGKGYYDIAKEGTNGGKHGNKIRTENKKGPTHG